MTKSLTPTVALLRAVNVGGTGKLPMRDLKAMADELGLANARTFIASGNLLFDTALKERDAQQLLAERLERYAGKPVGVLIRTGEEMAAVVAANPFSDCPGNRVIAFFLNSPPSTDILNGIRGQRDERIALGTREIYIHYGDGMASSKLVIPNATAGTARNMNSVTKIAELLVGKEQA